MWAYSSIYGCNGHKSCLYNNVYILYSSFKKYPHVNADDSVIIETAQVQEAKALLMSQQMVNARTFEPALKAVEDTSKSWVQIYMISQKVRMQYELRGASQI